MRARLVASLVVLAAAVPVAAHAQTPVHWSIGPRDRTASGPFTIVITARIDEGWHLYAMSEPPGPVAVTFRVPKDGPFALAGPITESPPAKKFDPNFNVMTEFHEGTATFTLPVSAAPSVSPGAYPLAVTVNFQTCTDRVCLPPKDEPLEIRDRRRAGWRALGRGAVSRRDARAGR